MNKRGQGFASGCSLLNVFFVLYATLFFYSVREANDRGYDCLVLEDCVGSYFPQLQLAALEMIKAQGGLFGWVSHSEKVHTVLADTSKTSEKASIASK